MIPADHSTGAPERLHPLFLLTGLGGTLRGIAGAYAFIAYLAVSGRLSTALAGLALLFAFSAVATLLYWTRFEYRVGPSEIRIDSGILSRTHRSIPFDRIQDVDISQGLFGRLLGIAAVKFETGGSAGTEEGVLKAVTLDRAHELRELVRAHGLRGAALAAQSDGEEQAPIYAMSFPRLVLAGVFNFSLAVFAALFGLTQTVGDVIGFDPFSRSFWRSLASFSEPVQHFIAAHRAVTAIAGLMSLLVIGTATGIVRTAVRDYGFRLDRTETGLRRRRGLVSVTDVTLPVKRAQAAIVASGPVRDAFGWQELKLQSLAADEGGRGDHVLAPLASGGESGRILQALGWRPLAPQPQWLPVSSAYVWVLAIATAPLALIAAGEALFAPLLGLAVLALLASAVAVRWLAWRRTGYRLDGDRLLIRTGWWRRRTLVLPVRRIQSIDLVQNFVSRGFGSASLAFGIAGGTGFSAHTIPLFPEDRARALRSELLLRIL